MQLNLTLNFRLNLRWNLDVNVDFSMYVKVVPLSRYSTGQRALFRDDQVVMQPTMITLPTLPSFPSSSSSIFGPKRPFQTIPVLSYHNRS